MKIRKILGQNRVETGEKRYIFIKVASCSAHFLRKHSISQDNRTILNCLSFPTYDSYPNISQPSWPRKTNILPKHDLSGY